LAALNSYFVATYLTLSAFSLPALTVSLDLFRYFPLGQNHFFPSSPGGSAEGRQKAQEQSLPLANCFTVWLSSFLRWISPFSSRSYLYQSVVCLQKQLTQKAASVP
jgi:hypothetical protein